MACDGEGFFVEEKRAMSRRLATGVMLFAMASVAACTTSDVLEPSAMTGSTASTNSNSLPPAIGPTGKSGPVAAISSTERIQVAPIVGSTVEAVTPLTERLALKAKERGIKLAGSSDSSVTHVLKGYFSAITEGKQTTVIYVWDVLDPAGNRLHRIQGQQKVAAAGGRDGWASVPAETMQAIADQTVDQLTQWLSAKSG
jgi:hypothetical protein